MGMITHHGITAEVEAWTDSGLAYVSGEIKSSAPYGYEAELLAARAAAGASDWRALAEYARRKEEARHEFDRREAVIRQANAIDCLAKALARLPVAEAVEALRRLVELDRADMTRESAR